MNRCYRIQAEGSVLFLKSYATPFYRPEQIARTCEVQTLACHAGLPTPAIVPNKEGSAVTVTEEGFYVLSRFVSGLEYARGEVPESAAFHMGTALARLQGFLVGLGDVVPADLPNPLAAAARLESLLARAEAKRHPSETDWIARRLLRYKIEALHESAALFAEVRGLPAQWVHGDYQALNLIFDGAGQVCAVLDFDQLQRRPRGLEAMRALDFSFSHAQVTSGAGLGFFRGYIGAAAIGENALTKGEVRLLVPLWTYYRLTRPWPLDVRYEKPEDYDARWDALIRPPDDWWERNGDEVTERLLEELEKEPENEDRMGECATPELTSGA